MIAWFDVTTPPVLPGWRSTGSPGETLLLGLLGLLAVVVAAALLSNRVQRGLRSIAAGLLCRLWLDHRKASLRLLTPLERVGTLEEFLERLPWTTASVAGVQPVTLYVLDDEGNQYRPTSSTLVSGPCTAVGGDQPLAKTLRRARRVRYLSGRPDDLENAPIHAVNGQQIEECQAVCALPLRRDGVLVAFLLCGGSEGRRLGLRNSGCLEGLLRRYTDIIQRCPTAEVTITARLAPGAVIARQSVNV
jgi:hypothetical protein